MKINLSYQSKYIQSPIDNSEKHILLCGDKDNYYKTTYNLTFKK